MKIVHFHSSGKYWKSYENMIDFVEPIKLNNYFKKVKNDFHWSIFFSTYAWIMNSVWMKITMQIYEQPLQYIVYVLVSFKLDSELRIRAPSFELDDLCQPRVTNEPSWLENQILLGFRRTNSSQYLCMSQQNASVILNCLLWMTCQKAAVSHSD